MGAQAGDELASGRQAGVDPALWVVIWECRVVPASCGKGLGRFKLGSVVTVHPLTNGMDRIGEGSKTDGFGNNGLTRPGLRAETEMVYG